MDVLALVLAAALAPAAPQAEAPAAGPAVREEPAARALWDEVVRAAVGERTQRVTSFRIEFDATSYSEGQSNDASATYSFLEPGWVRMAMAKTGRERMRGPEGDWLIDKAGPRRLAGRDFKQDIAELDESVSVARTFAHLTDPRGLRMESLRVMPAPPELLPAKVAGLAAELDWLHIESRDLRGPPAAGAPSAAPDVLELGIERDTRVPRVAILTEPARPHLTLALAFGLEGGRWKEGYAVDGFRVPYSVTAWRIDAAQEVPMFAEQQALDLWFKDGTLAPKLSSADFVPPPEGK